MFSLLMNNNNIKLIIILTLFAFSLMGCRKEREENRTDFISGLASLYEIEENVPFEEQVFEQLLIQETNRNLYFNLSDYRHSYIGLTIDYLVFGYDSILSDRTKHISFIIIWSPPEDSKKESTYSTWRIYENGMIEFLGAYGYLESLNNLIFDKNDEKFPEFLTEMLTSNNAKVFYQGKLVITEPTQPIYADFEDKNDIIDKICNDEVLSLISDDLGVSESLSIYIQDFTEHDSYTNMLLIPDDNISNVVIVRYNIHEMEVDIRSSNMYYDEIIDLTRNDEISKRHLHFYNRMQQSAIRILKSGSKNQRGEKSD